MKQWANWLLLVLLYTAYTVPLRSIEPKSQRQIVVRVLSYFDYLLEHTILKSHNLEHLLKNSDLVNPISQSEADENHAVLVHWKQINRILKEPSVWLVDMTSIHAWAQKNLALLKDHQQIKEEVRNETHDIYHPMNFVPLPAGKFMSTLDAQEFVIEPGTEIQDTPVTQWQWAKVMEFNPVDVTSDVGYQEVVINDKKILLQPDHAVHGVNYQIKKYIESINARDDQYEYFLPSANEYEVFLKEVLGPDWMQRIVHTGIDECDRAGAVTAGPFIEYGKQRVWGFVQHVWQYTRDMILLRKNSNIALIIAPLVFGLPHDVQEIPTSLESFLRPIGSHHKNKLIGFRLARRRKGISQTSIGDSLITINWKNADQGELKKWIPKPTDTLSRPSSMIYPLSDAVWNNDLALIELLLQCGVSVQEEEAYRPVSALISAITAGQVEITKLLLDYADVLHEKKGEEQQTPLHQLSQYPPCLREKWHSRLDEMIDLLIIRGADIDAQDRYGITPLMYAVKNSDFELASLLLRYKADINICDNRGYSPLMHACNSRELTYITSPEKLVHIISLLLEHKADVHKVDNFGNTALHVLAEDVVRRGCAIPLLLDAGVSINAQNNLKKTALHIALQNDLLVCQTIQLLLDSGASVDIKDYKGLTPLEQAEAELIWWKERVILDLLRAHKQQQITN